MDIYTETMSLHFRRIGTTRDDISLWRMTEIARTLGAGWELAGATQDTKIIPDEKTNATSPRG